MIHRLPQQEINKIKNDTAVQAAVMKMYERKYRQLQQLHGDDLPEVLQPWVERLQGKIYTIPTDKWSTAAHAVWVDDNYSAETQVHCHAAVYYQTLQDPCTKVSPSQRGKGPKDQGETSNISNT